ncbi:MAG: VWA domain-containing protein [Mariniblastus sp.]
MLQIQQFRREQLLARRSGNARTGAMLPLIAVVIIILFCAAVLAIDVARIHVTRSELRTATDAAARAGCEALGRQQSTAAAVSAALAIARENRVAGEPLDLDENNIVFGSAVLQGDGSFAFQTATGNDINSIRVVGERTAGSPNGPVNTMFGRMFGVNTFEPVQSATATRLDRDIALVLDKSGSMSSFGRFDALLNGVNVFLNELQTTTQQENVSLTAYDTFPNKLVDMTTDLNAIQQAINAETPNGFTGIGRALNMGLDSIQNDPNARQFSLKSIVLMTDGRQNRGVDPLTVAAICRDAGVQVHTITFSEGAQQDLMRGVAQVTGGTHIHADNDQQLIEAFQTIARQIQIVFIE